MYSKRDHFRVWRIWFLKEILGNNWIFCCKFNEKLWLYIYLLKGMSKVHYFWRSVAQITNISSTFLILNPWILYKRWLSRSVFIYNIFIFWEILKYLSFGCIRVCLSLCTGRSSVDTSSLILDKKSITCPLVELWFDWDVYKRITYWLSVMDLWSPFHHHIPTSHLHHDINPHHAPTTLPHIDRCSIFPSSCVNTFKMCLVLFITLDKSVMSC